MLPPEAPEPPIVSRVQATSCAVTFQPPSDDGGAPVTGYILERRTPGRGSEWIRVNDSPITDLQYTVDNLTPAIQHEFRLAAVNEAGTGKFSLPCLTVTVETPGRPGCPMVEVIGTSVYLQWTAPDSNGGAAITEYSVAYVTNDDTTYVPFPVADTAGYSMRFTLICLLQPSTKYRFVVAAVNTLGRGEWSASTREFITPAGTSLRT